MDNTDAPVLKIDGIQNSFSSIWCHYQSDPFPGGHLYMIRLPPVLARDWSQRAGRRERYAYDAMSDLAFVLSPLKTDETMEATYVLNNIENVTWDQGWVCIKGVCSKFLKRQADGTWG